MAGLCRLQGGYNWEDGMSETDPPAEMEPEKINAYIDQLHARIQFLEKELHDAEQTILELNQDLDSSLDTFLSTAQRNSDVGPGESLEVDLRRVGRYIRSIDQTGNLEKEAIESMYEALQEELRKSGPGTPSPANASFALWVILIQHANQAQNG